MIIAKRLQQQLQPLQPLLLLLLEWGRQRASGRHREEDTFLIQLLDGHNWAAPAASRSSSAAFLICRCRAEIENILLGYESGLDRREWALERPVLVQINEIKERRWREGAVYGNRRRE